MKHVKLAAALTVAALMTGTAAAANEFSFDFTYEKSRLETSTGAAEVFDALKEEIETHCTDERIIPRPLRAAMARPCIDATLERTVTQIDAPHLTEAYEDWKS